jgi:hypothetical protein
MLRKMVREVYSPRLPKPMSITESSFRLSAYILLEFLGPEWIDHYITHKGLILKTTYFGDGDVFFVRTTELAEMLLNLQDVPGFKGCLSTIAAGDIEAGFAELEVGKFLSWFGVKFRFNAPSRKPKSDFDLHVTFRNEYSGYGEVKAKQEVGPLTETTVYNTLRIAQRQFPDDRPAAVFLKLPEAWGDAENRKTIDDQVRRFLRGTQKVVTVELFLTGFRIEGGVAEPIIAGIEVLNENHRFDRTLDWSLIGPVLPEPTDLHRPFWWRSIYALIDPTVDPRWFRP